MDYTKILILGVPRAGKSTLAEELQTKLDIPLVHIDQWVKDMPWSFVSDKVAEKLDTEGPWIMEGVAGIRGLRKWLLLHQGKPDCYIVWLSEPKVKLTAGQDNMRSGTLTIFKGVKETLDFRGITILDSKGLKALFK